MDKKQNIRFSILIPVYNTERYLDACIASVLEQTLPAFELILVDDGSTDRSGSICDRYAEKYDNIQVYHKDNGGQLHTRLYAIDKATGDYCVFLDSDDTLRKNALEILDRKIKAYHCDCAIFRWERVYNGKVLHPAEPIEDVCVEDKAELYRKCFFSTVYNSMCIKAVKRSLLQPTEDYTDYFDIRFGEDLLQSLEVLKKSQKVAFIGDVLYNYTANPNSVTLSQNYGNYQISIFVRKRVAELLQEEAVWSEDDFVQYRGYCARLFCDEIIRICALKINIQQKKTLLQKLRNHEYYQDFLKKGKYAKRYLGWKIVLFYLFKKDWFAWLLLGDPLKK